MVKKMNEVEKPVSNEVLEVHLGYLREEQHRMNASLHKLLLGMSEMATKSDLEKLSSRFVTTDRFDALEKKVDKGTIGSTFDRWVSVLTKLFAAGTALTAFIGLIYAFVRFSDKISLLVK